jgi:Trk-type K+ transport system membrane component
MAWVLKIILVIFMVACGFCFNYIFKDWNGIRKTEGFGEITPFERIKFHLVFFALFAALSSLALFLTIIIASKVELTFFQW